MPVSRPSSRQPRFPPWSPPTQVGSAATYAPPPFFNLPVLTRATGPAIDLYIWGNAESCVTIIAACIPILRVLIRDVKTSAQRYYVSNTNRSGVHSSAHHSKVRDNQNTITITAGRRTDTSSSHQDEEERGLTRESGKIMQTREVAVEYQEHRDWASDHELDDMRRSHKSL